MGKWMRAWAHDLQSYNAREDPLLFSAGDTEMLNSKKYSGVSEFALSSNLKAQFVGLPPFLCVKHHCS